MELLAVVARWVHLTGASLLVGVFGFLLLVARPALGPAAPETRAAFARLDRRLLGLAMAGLAAAVTAGLVDLARQAVAATGLGLRGALAPAALGTLLLDTRYGQVWLARHGLLLLLGMLLLLREAERDARDWVALRLQGLGLATASLGLLAGAGHAAAAPGPPIAAVAVDALHLLAAGLWGGGLLPLALFLRWTTGLPDPEAARLAAGAARRFSGLGLAGVGMLAASGSYGLWAQVGGLPAFVGTPYGRWLALKLALLLPVLGLAAANRGRLLPRLGRAAAGDRQDPRPLAERLRRRVLGEGGLALAILGIVGILGLTPPARHAEPTWPFPYRLDWTAVRTVPGAQTRVAVGSQVAVLGLAAALLAVVVPGRRTRWVAAAGCAAVAAGLATALPPLAVDAYPTTYRRPGVPYTASSIATGGALYRVHCAPCHGVAGYGDGPLAATLRPRPADLTGAHAAHHTAGDLFWWLTHGIPGSAMPGFADRLSEEERWDVINFVRTLASAEQARRLGALVDPDPVAVAPDLAFTTGVGEPRSLREYRGGRVVLVVFFTLPESAPRLLELATLYPALRLAGAEVLGVPVRRAEAVYRDLGAAPVFFPIAVEGAEEAVAAYRLFRRDLSAEGQAPDPPPPHHMELLVDRQGYLRARWIPGDGPGFGDPGRLTRAVEELAREAPRAPAPAEHIH